MADNGKWIGPKDIKSWVIIDGILGETITENDLIYLDTSAPNIYSYNGLVYHNNYDSSFSRASSMEIYGNRLYMAYTYEKLANTDSDGGVGFRRWQPEGYWSDIVQNPYWSSKSSRYWEIKLHSHLDRLYCGYALSNSPYIHVEYLDLNESDYWVPTGRIIGLDDTFGANVSFATFNDELYVLCSLGYGVYVGGGNWNTNPNHILLYKYNQIDNIWEIQNDVGWGEFRFLSYTNYHGELYVIGTKMFVIVTGEDDGNLSTNYIENFVFYYTLDSNGVWSDLTRPTPNPDILTHSCRITESGGEFYLVTENISSTLHPFYVYKLVNGIFTKIANPYPDYPFNDYIRGVSAVDYNGDLVITVAIQWYPFLATYRLFGGSSWSKMSYDNGELPDIQNAESVDMKVYEGILYLMVTAISSDKNHITTTYTLGRLGTKWILSQTLLGDDIGVAQESGVTDDEIKIKLLRG